MGKNLRYDEQILYVPLYNGRFGIVVTNDIKRLQKRFNLEDHDVDDEIYGHTYYLDYKGNQLF